MASWARPYTLFACCADCLVRCSLCVLTYLCCFLLHCVYFKCTHTFCVFCDTVYIWCVDWRAVKRLFVTTMFLSHRVHLMYHWESAKSVVAFFCPTVYIWCAGRRPVCAGAQRHVSAEVDAVAQLSAQTWSDVAQGLCSKPRNCLYENPRKIISSRKIWVVLFRCGILIFRSISIDILRNISISIDIDIDTPDSLLSAVAPSN